MLELADALTTEEAEAAEAYLVLSKALDALGRGVAATALRQAFELQMLSATGFGLEFADAEFAAKSRSWKTVRSTS